MQFLVVQRVLGYLLSMFSFTMVVPLLLSLWYQDAATMPFLVGSVATLLSGLLLMWPVRKQTAPLRLRDGYLIVVAFWTVLGVFGALPLYLYSAADLSIAQAVFESMSGLTTTGATVIVGLDRLPPSILFYRQELQWLGGMGIIVLAVAILPMLGIGGMQLYRAETPGPKKDKLTPRVAETAKILWYLYLFLTVACALAYYFAGMSAFDAIAHSFSTVAIGGFSTHDASIGYFDSRTIDLIAVVFMFICGLNFSLHFAFVHSLPTYQKEREMAKKSLLRYLPFVSSQSSAEPSGARESKGLRGISVRHYFVDSEAKFYCFVLLVVTLIVFFYLCTLLDSIDFRTFVFALFQSVSFATTTGFSTNGPVEVDFAYWPEFLPVLLIFASFVGGCSGSTGGGMKAIRVLMLYKQSIRELQRMMHPNAKLLVKVGKTPLPERTQEVVWGFLSAYVGLFIIFMLILMLVGLDQETAFSAVAACMNNLGPGLGDVMANYSSINDISLMVLSVAMLFGRLEIFTLLVLFTPAFWRH